MHSFLIELFLIDLIPIVDKSIQAVGCLEIVMAGGQWSRTVVRSDRRVEGGSLSVFGEWCLIDCLNNRVRSYGPSQAWRTC